MTQMIALDGSFGEGGGALVRTALALSMFTGKPFRVTNVREGRKQPGLKAQHLRAIEALKTIAPGTKTSIVEMGTTEFWFHPGEIKSGHYSFDIKTAGSITLFLQAILLPCLFAPGKVTLNVKGGTCGKWQASVDYMQQILLPNLQRFAKKLNLSITKRGYYPKGGGEITLEITPKNKQKEHDNHMMLLDEISKTTKTIQHTTQGECEYFKGFINTSKDLTELDVARRVESAASASLRNMGIPISIDNGYFPALSTGGELLLWSVHSKNGEINPTDCVRLATSVLIEKGISSEEIGQKAAKNLKLIMDTKAATDFFLADQLLIFMAILPGSSITASKITEHTKTNIHIIEHFLDCKFKLDENKITVTKN